MGLIMLSFLQTKLSDHHFFPQVEKESEETNHHPITVWDFSTWPWLGYHCLNHFMYFNLVSGFKFSIIFVRIPRVCVHRAIRNTRRHPMEIYPESSLWPSFGQQCCFSGSDVSPRGAARKHGRSPALLLCR